ncbi:MAG TPA: alpha/beta fold hydrolase [Luteibaculaceae bacterium]|nr:alpha/beta fold hydrolase [Luteibaculaceae bacterium]
MLHRSVLLLMGLVIIFALPNAKAQITDSILHQGYQRKFMVHLPDNYQPGVALPLVISLHGGSGNMVNAQGFSRLNPVADKNGFIVAWPQGIGSAPPGFSWADGRNTSADQMGIDDVGFIHALIDTLKVRFQLDTQRIYACGFSNGGFMVQRLACETPERFAAMASLGSSMDTVRFQTCLPSKPVPMAFFNGTSDPAMPYEGGVMQNPQVLPVVPVDSVVQRWVKHNSCQQAEPVVMIPDSLAADESTAEFYRYTQCDCAADVWFYKLINGGHTWPGVYVASQAAVLGNTNLDIDGSTELWRFFSPFKRCAANEVGIESQTLAAFSLYPNPAENTLHIDGLFEPLTELKIILYSSTGQILATLAGSKTIDIEFLETGLYHLQIDYRGNRIQKRFAKH